MYAAGYQRQVNIDNAAEAIKKMTELVSGL
jgi:hypothetical protein